MDNILEGCLGLPGSSLFERWLNLPGEWVETPNERRGGSSGVQRLRTQDGRLLYRKLQVNHRYRDWRHPPGEPTVLREQRALQAFARLGIRVPQLVFCETRQHAGRQQAMLVTAALEGFESLEECYARNAPKAWSEALREAVFVQLGVLLSRLHRARWQHGCLYPKHIFLRIDESGRAELALLDLEKSRRRLTCRQAARHNLRQLRRHAPWGAAEWTAIERGYRSRAGHGLEA